MPSGMNYMDKQIILNDIMKQLDTHIERIGHAYTTVQQAAHDAPGRMQSRYDTSKVENSWLADGIGDRLVELEDQRDTLRRFRVPREPSEELFAGYIAIVAHGTEKTHYLMLPACGGATAKQDGVEITVITPVAPIGQALLLKKKGDRITFRGVEHIIEEIL